MTLHADVIEVAWTLVALVGVALAVAALLDALTDYRLVRDQAGSPDRERRLECAIVRGDVASAWWIVTVETLNGLVGVLAMVQEAPPGGRSLLGWTIIAFLLAAAAVMPVRLVDQRRRRHQLLDGD